MRSYIFRLCNDYSFRIRQTLSGRRTNWSRDVFLRCACLQEGGINSRTRTSSSSHVSSLVHTRFYSPHTRRASLSLRYGVSITATRDVSGIIHLPTTPERGLSINILLSAWCDAINSPLPFPFSLLSLSRGSYFISPASWSHERGKNKLATFWSPTWNLAEEYAGLWMERQLLHQLPWPKFIYELKYFL